MDPIILPYGAGRSAHQLHAVSDSDSSQKNGVVDFHVRVSAHDIRTVQN